MSLYLLQLFPVRLYGPMDTGPLRKAPSSFPYACYSFRIEERKYEYKENPQTFG